MSIGELLRVSRDIGRRVPHWTQGAGANISLKEGDTLFIKVSGLRLDEMTSEEHLARVKIRETSHAISAIPGDGQAAEKQYSNALQGARKPSMETGMHLFLPRKWVFHFHSLAALLMAHENAENPARLKEWLNGAPIQFVEPVRPGLLLSKRIKAAHAAAAPFTSFYVLQNHGVLLEGDTPDVLSAWDDFEKKFCQDFGFLKARTATAHAPTPFRLYFPDSAVFIERIKKILTPTGTGNKGEALFELKEDGRLLDRDAYEIWWATEILYDTCPALGELPSAISAVVADLPTEKYRRGETA